jgi:hypothetical protein
MTRTNCSLTASTRTAALCVAALVGLAVSAAPAAAGDCNPLTLLFGGCQQARVAPALPAYEPLVLTPQASRQKAALPHAHARKPLADAAHRHVAHKSAEAAKSAEAHKPIAQRPDAPVGSVARFAADPTLRAGDIVVTTQGFRVYRNNRFTAIAQDGGALAQLEKASMRPKTAAVSEVVTTSGEKSGLVALRRAIRVASSQ